MEILLATAPLEKVAVGWIGNDAVEQQYGSMPEQSGDYLAVSRSDWVDGTPGSTRFSIEHAFLSAGNWSSLLSE